MSGGRRTPLAGVYVHSLYWGGRRHVLVRAYGVLKGQCSGLQSCSRYFAPSSAGRVRCLIADIDVKVEVDIWLFVWVFELSLRLYFFLKRTTMHRLSVYFYVRSPILLRASVLNGSVRDLWFNANGDVRTV